MPAELGRKYRPCSFARLESSMAEISDFRSTAGATKRSKACSKHDGRQLHGDENKNTDCKLAEKMVALSTHGYPSSSNVGTCTYLPRGEHPRSSLKLDSHEIAYPSPFDKSDFLPIGSEARIPTLQVPPCGPRRPLLTSSGSDVDDEDGSFLVQEICKLNRANQELKFENSELKLKLVSLQTQIHRLVLFSEEGNTTSTPCLPKTIDNETEASLRQTISLQEEQLNIYREDFKEERQQCEKLRERNIALQNDLEDSKKLLENQSQKLIMYAQLASCSKNWQATLKPHAMESTRKCSSVPTTPSYITNDTKRPVSPSLMARHYVNNIKVLDHESRDRSFKFGSSRSKPSNWYENLASDDMTLERTKTFSHAREYDEEDFIAKSLGTSRGRRSSFSH